MSITSNLLKAHSALVGLLDRKFREDAAWQAFREVDAALIAELSVPSSPQDHQPGLKQPWIHFEDPSQHVLISPVVRRQRTGSALPYADLAAQKLDEIKKPVSTPVVVAYIAARRPIPDDPEKAKTNISSALSHDSRFQSVPWQGGRAWWWANTEVPKEESADLLG
jgi:hypothetical protein